MRNFKTDKGYKIVIDYVDWYYSWRELRDYFALDEEWVFFCFPGDRDMAEIMDLDIPKEWVQRLLWRRMSESEDIKNAPWRDWYFDEDDMKRYEEELIERYGKYEKEYEIRPFYISYYGSGEYRVQFCEAQEWAWIMLIKRRKGGQQNATEFWAKVFEHYVEWNFLYAQCYSPHPAFFSEWAFRDKYDITYYDYEDGEIFCFDEKWAIDWIPEEFGKILPETESEHFESFELTPKKKTGDLNW